MKWFRMLLATFLVLAALLPSAGPADAASTPSLCPAIGYDTMCGAVVTVTDQGSSMVPTGQLPYDGQDDTLVGVDNQSKQPIHALEVSSRTNDIFSFDGDGICANPNPTSGKPGISCSPNTRDPSGYGGPNVYFTNIAADGKQGTVNFIVPIPPGGSGYFTLENRLDSTIGCADAINNGLSPGQPGVLPDGNIDATFTPNVTRIPSLAGLTLQEVAQRYCGFIDFDWTQTVTHKDDPSEFWALNQGGAFDSTVPGPVRLTSRRVKWSDPPQGGGYTYNSPP